MRFFLEIGDDSIPLSDLGVKYLRIVVERFMCFSKYYLGHVIIVRNFGRMFLKIQFMLYHQNENITDSEFGLAV